MKRAFDIVVSASALIVLSPLILAVGLVVRIFMGSPILFCQLRPGWRAKPFRMFKFRTMRDATNEGGEPLSDAERLTPLGRFLRSTSLDELPELWNVIRGDMSLVGPRPLRLEYLARYTPEQARRHLVRPGITGWAQVNGRNAIAWTEKFRLDTWYVDNRTFWLDLRILALTVRCVISRSGVAAEGGAIMPEFMGEQEEDRDRSARKDEARSVQPARARSISAKDETM